MKRIAIAVLTALVVGLGLGAFTNNASAVGVCDGWWPSPGWTVVKVPIPLVPVGVEVAIVHNNTIGESDVVGVCVDSGPTAPGLVGQSVWMSAEAGPTPGAPGQWYGGGVAGSGNVNFNLGTGSNPQWSVSTSGITVAIPVTVVCLNSFCPGAGVGQTGALVGTITQAPGAVSAAYGLSSLCLYVNGAPLGACSGVGPTGVTTTGRSPENIHAAGPCVSGICVPVFPDSYVGTTGDQLATVWLAGIAVPVYGVHTCPYQASAGRPCPW